MLDNKGKKINIGDLVEIIYSSSANQAIYSFLNVGDVAMILDIENKKDLWDGQIYTVEFLTKKGKQRLAFRRYEVELVFQTKM